MVVSDFVQDAKVSVVLGGAELLANDLEQLPLLVRHRSAFRNISDKSVSLVAKNIVLKFLAVMMIYALEEVDYTRIFPRSLHFFNSVFAEGWDKSALVLTELELSKKLGHSLRGDVLRDIDLLLQLLDSLIVTIVFVFAERIFFIAAAGARS